MQRRLAPALRASVGLHAAAGGLLLAAPQAWGWAAGALLADHAVLTAAGLWPQSTLLGPNLTRLPAAAGAVALTFDDGPDPAVTPRVLDLLGAAGARATFFCIGAAARAQPGLVRRMVAEGHAVQNHTGTHPLHFAALGVRGMRREVAAAQMVLAELAGIAPCWFRAPAGLRNPLLDPVLAREGLRLASWTRRAYDGTRGDAPRALARLTWGLAPGDILLMHDGRAARTEDGVPVVLAILPALLATLRRQRLRSVALSAGC